MCGVGREPSSESEFAHMLKALTGAALVEEEGSTLIHSLVSAEELRAAIDGSKLATITGVLHESIASESKLAEDVHVLSFEAQAMLVVACGVAESTGAKTLERRALKKAMKAFAPNLGSKTSVKQIEAAASSMSPLVQQLSAAGLVSSEGRKGALKLQCSLEQVLAAVTDKRLRVAALSLVDSGAAVSTVEVMMMMMMMMMMSGIILEIR